jgi:RNA polymerase sigma-70 factor (family 1)
MNEKDLFLLISKGDERAFHQLFHLYNKQLLPFIYKLVQSDAAAEEIVQEVFIKIWNNRQKLSEINVPKAWIIRIVSNEAYNYLRKQATEGRLLKNIKERSQEHTLTPEDAMSERELSTIIQSGISQLPPQMKMVYLLNKEDGLSIAEIAEKLGISPNTVKNHLVSALKKLRIYIIEHRMILILWALISKT